MKRFGIIGSVLLLCVVGLVPTLAQTASFVITEATINAGYRVTAPPRTTISAVNVDLQPGQVVITSSFTPRRTNVTTTAVTTLTPAIVDGAMEWQLVSVTVDGQPASQATIDQVNTGIVNTWRVYFHEQAGIDLLSVSISDTEITYTYDSDRRTSTTTTVTQGSAITTVTEADVNAAITDTTSIKNVTVNFQPNTVTIQGDYTGSRGNSVTAFATYSPTVANCDVAWTLTDSGVSATTSRGTRTSTINSLQALWTSYWATQDARVCVGAVTLTDTALSYTLTR